MIHLAFKHNKNIAITDFRDFQRIKNELVNKEAYAIQVFPPESQLVDTSNHYHLWVMGQFSELGEGLEDSWPRLPYGFEDQRLVMEDIDDSRVGARGRQRMWPENEKPEGLETHREAYHRAWKEAKANGNTEKIEALVRLSYQADKVAGRKLEMMFAEFEASAKEEDA